MKNPFDNFDRVFLVNLPLRTDRLMDSLYECEKVGIKSRVELVEGINQGHQGFLEAIYGITMRLEVGENFLLLEDDVQFINNPIETLSQAYEQIQYEKWDVLYFGALTRKRIDLRFPSWYRIKYGYCCHAVVFSAGIVDTIRKLTKSFMTKNDAVFDRLLSEYVQPFNPCYLITPMIAVQRPSYSDLEKKNVNYDLEKRFEQMQSYQKSR